MPMSDKTDFLTKAIKKERHYKMIKESRQDTPPINKVIYVPNITLKYTNTNKRKNWRNTLFTIMMISSQIFW